MKGKHWYCSKVEGNCMELDKCKKRKKKIAIRPKKNTLQQNIQLK
jgi:hypothetical protein